MASLSISIAQGSYNEADNSVMVSVSVTISYGAESWNASGGSGTLYVNDVPFSFSATFNENQSGAGSKTLYSTSVCIDLNVTNVVSCSAIYDYGSAGGPISASNSKTLSAGSSGGDSSGGSGDGGPDYEDVVYYHCDVFFTVGDNTSIIIDSGLDTEKIITQSCKESFSNSSATPYKYITVTFVADERYKLSECSINGDVCGQEERINVRINGSYNIVSSATPLPGLSYVYEETIDRSNFAPYYCFVDTEYIEYPELMVDGLFDERIQGEYLSYNTDQPVSWKICTGEDELYVAVPAETTLTWIHSACLQFTPSFVGESKGIAIHLEHDGSSSDVEIGWALCSSDLNRDRYLVIGEPVVDEYQLASGSVFANNTEEIIVNTKDILTESTYHLFLWPMTRFADALIRLSWPKSKQSYTIDLVTEPVHGTRFELYEAYIDNGTGWDVCY